MLLAVVVLTGVCFAKDVYVRPTVVSGDTIRARGKTYRLWGISAPKGGWNTVAMAALSQMTKGLEFKLLVSSLPGIYYFLHPHLRCFNKFLPGPLNVFFIVIYLQNI